MFILAARDVDIRLVCMKLSEEKRGGRVSSAGLTRKSRREVVSLIPRSCGSPRANPLSWKSRQQSRCSDNNSSRLSRDMTPLLVLRGFDGDWRCRELRRLAVSERPAVLRDAERGPRREVEDARDLVLLRFDGRWVSPWLDAVCLAFTEGEDSCVRSGSC